MPFQKGQSGNPSGRPAGRQAFIDRASKYLEEHTVDELLALAKDKARFGKLCVIDGMIVRRLSVAIIKADGADMERILDRVIGKVPVPREEKPERQSWAELLMQSRADDLDEE